MNDVIFVDTSKLSSVFISMLNIISFIPFSLETDLTQYVPIMQSTTLCTYK